jgi:2-polyprenyl-3-methyl-5-hydroxy-6-metoxy-1,4-benzoquinol methylase
MIVDILSVVKKVNFVDIAPGLGILSSRLAQAKVTGQQQSGS